MYLRWEKQFGMRREENDGFLYFSRKIELFSSFIVITLQ
ncbi:hypothetical protein BAXH7_01391 [Bacillus amyloliquefaciens XH7]|nr:hypothetical protein BAXH7_01391 [Bacillus amyloliquefaciens XH7]